MSDPAEPALEAALDALFAAPFPDFVAERKRLVGALRASGHRAAATALGKVNRPTLASWTINQLVRRAPTELDALFAAAHRVRLGEHAASANHRTLLARLQSQAVEVLRAAEQPTSDATLRRIATTLQALSAYGGFAPDKPGRLIADRDPPGFDAMDLTLTASNPGSYLSLVPPPRASIPATSDDDASPPRQAALAPRPLAADRAHDGDERGGAAAERAAGTAMRASARGQPAAAAEDAPGAPVAGPGAPVAGPGAPVAGPGELGDHTDPMLRLVPTTAPPSGPARAQTRERADAASPSPDASTSPGERAPVASTPPPSPPTSPVATVARAAPQALATAATALATATAPTAASSSAASEPRGPAPEPKPAEVSAFPAGAFTAQAAAAEVAAAQAAAAQAATLLAAAQAAARAAAARVAVARQRALLEELRARQRRLASAIYDHEQAILQLERDLSQRRALLAAAQRELPALEAELASVGAALAGADGADGADGP